MGREVLAHIVNVELLIYGDPLGLFRWPFPVYHGAAIPPFINPSHSPRLFVCLLLAFVKAAVGRVETGPPAAQAGLGLPCHHTWFVVLSHTVEETEVALM